MNPAMLYIWNRLKEPSTHSGLGMAAQGCKLLFPGHDHEIDGISFIFAGFAIFMWEKKP